LKCVFRYENFGIGGVIQFRRKRFVEEVYGTIYTRFVLRFAKCISASLNVVMWKLI